MQNLKSLPELLKKIAKGPRIFKKKHFELLEAEEAGGIEEEYSSDEHEDSSHAHKKFNKGKGKGKGKGKEKDKHKDKHKDKNRTKEKKTTDASPLEHSKEGEAHSFYMDMLRQLIIGSEAASQSPFDILLVDLDKEKKECQWTQKSLDAFKPLLKQTGKVNLVQ